MKRLRRLLLSSLAAQLVLSFALVAILGAVIAGLLGWGRARSQLELQSWVLLDQGNQTTLDLLDAERIDLGRLAQLTAQRPTLQALSGRGASPELDSYLSTLRTGAGLDAINLCADDQTLIAQSGADIDPAICGLVAGDQIFLDTLTSSAWMLSSQSLPHGRQVVIVGRAIDNQLAEQLSSQTGVEQIFYFDGKLVAASFDDPLAANQAAVAGALLTGDLNRSKFTQAGIPYQAVRLRFPGSTLEVLSALPVGNIERLQRETTINLVIGILIGAVAASLLGALLANRINQPLQRLRQAAEGLRQGDLATPIAVATRLNEVGRVVIAMEDARIALQHSLEEVRQQKDWIEHLLDSIIEGIVTLDRQGRITSLSRAAERITGWREAECLGRSVDDVFQCSESGDRFSQQLPPPGGQQKISVRLPNGINAILAVSGARLAPPTAGRAATVMVMRDVTNEESMRRLLGDFLANITHEFRTPLSALAASVELLMDDLPHINTEEALRLLLATHLGILDLQTLTDNLLEGASLETGRFRIQPQEIDISEIIAEAVRLMNPLLEKYRQRLELEIPMGCPAVIADPRRTQQVIINLLSNAAKWGAENGLVHLRLHTTQGYLRLEVSDQGPGIPTEHRSDLFQRFVHMGSEKGRSSYGAGIGLSVVKAIVEAQGGQVGVEDNPGGGTRFWFTIPLAVIEEP